MTRSRPAALALLLLAPACIVVQRSVDGAPPAAAPLGEAPAAGGEVVAAGLARVDLVSGAADRRWDVYSDDQVVCTTPCTRMLDPGRPLALRTRDDGWGGRPELVRLPDLWPEARGGAVRVVATPTRRGRLATGITFTSLGGMAAITGITLASVGCSDLAERRGMCTAGGITLVGGALATAGGILMILDSGARAEVLEGRVAGAARPGVTFGPGFVAGKF